MLGASVRNDLNAFINWTGLPSAHAVQLGVAHCILSFQQSTLWLRGRFQVGAAGSRLLDCWKPYTIPAGKGGTSSAPQLLELSNAALSESNASCITGWERISPISCSICKASTVLFVCSSCTCALHSYLCHIVTQLVKLRHRHVEGILLAICKRHLHENGGLHHALCVTGANGDIHSPSQISQAWEPCAQVCGRFLQCGTPAKWKNVEICSSKLA